MLYISYEVACLKFLYNFSIFIAFLFYLSLMYSKKQKICYYIQLTLFHSEFLEKHIGRFISWLSKI